MKKVIRLTESDLTRIVKRVIEEQSERKCFDQKVFDSLKKTQGHLNVMKVKPGDTWSEIQRMTDDGGKYILEYNKFCDVKNPKIGDLIMYSTLPTR